MAKKSVIARNEKRRRLCRRYGARRAALKKQIYDKNLSDEERFQLALRLSMLPRDSSPIRVRRRCAMTGRGRGTYRRFGLSRLVLREMASFGQVPGVVRSSW